MSRLVDMLENSQLVTMIEHAERGKPIDFKKALLQQQLLAARAGDLFLLDFIAREDKADEQQRR